MGDRETLAAFDGELDELARLTKANCKPLILSLTMIAEESVHAAPAIVALICRKLAALPPDRLLTVLYLWDSLSQSKGSGGRYREAFTPRLVSTIGASLERAPAGMRVNIEKLLGVWRVGRVFPTPLLDELDARARRLAGVAEPAPTASATPAAVADVGAKRARAPTPPLEQQQAYSRQALAPAPLPPAGGAAAALPVPQLKHFGRQPAALSKLPPQMAALRRDIGPFVGAPNPNPELLRDADELMGMYEYLLAVEGEGAVISGRTTLVAELAELAQWRAAVGGAVASYAAPPAARAQPEQLLLPPPPPPPRAGAAQPPARGGAGARGVGVPPPFPPGPCVHIFELFNALSQLDMLPLPSALVAPSAPNGAVGASARAPAIMRPFEPRSAVHRLYDGLPLQCPLSGVRFAHGAQRQLRAHTDRQFKRAQRRPAGGPPPSRAWLRSLPEWLSLYGTEQEHMTQAPTSFFGDGAAAQGAGAGGEGGGAQPGKCGAPGGAGGGSEPGGAAADADAAAPRGTAVPAPAGVDLSELTCALSQEPLESFYDPDADEWMVRDALLLPDGRLCHVKSLPASAAVGTPGRLSRRESRVQE